MFASIRKVLSQPFSDDERIIFELTEERVPIDMREKFAAQVGAILRSAPSGDQKSIVYALNVSKL